MKIRLLRHATIVLDYAGKRIMVDPVLSPAGTANPIPTRGEGHDRRNPLVELPVSAAELGEIVASLDGALVTHLHQDHFDEVAARLLPDDLPLLCQAEDEPRLRQRGFTALQPIADSMDWQGIRIARTRGRHGGLVVGRRMGQVSGFVLASPGEPALYIAGDTIWCRRVRTALARHRPAVTVVNAGAAQLPSGRSITMNTRDIAKICRFAPWTKIVAVHMEAINHCLLGREELRRFLAEKGLDARVIVPEDGETVVFE